MPIACAGHKETQRSAQMHSNIHAQSNSLKGFLYALGGTFLVSTNFITAKYGLKGFNPETFSLVWTAAAAVYSFLIVLSSGQWRQMALSSRAARDMMLMGLATGVAMISGWAGLARLDSSFAAFLWRFQPVLTIMLSVFFLRERFSVKEIAPVAIMILGGCLSTIGRWDIVGIGIILTLLACCAAAVQMLIAKARVHEIRPNILVVYRVGIGAVVIMLWSLVTGKIDFHVEASYWYVTLLGALLGPCASFLLTFRSYRYWELSRSSMVKTAEPLFVLPLAYVVFGKLPIGKELLGGCVILIGAFWLAWIHLIKKRDVVSI
jgi:drug/metabolite transporter (DMT)-like permease